MTRPILATALFALTLSGQVDVTVSRQLMPGATEALFTVDATAPASTGLPQVAAVLEPVGVRAEHLQRVAVFQQGVSIPILGQSEPATITYSFELNYGSPPGGWKACRWKWTAFSGSRPRRLRGSAFRLG